jgi:uncharacterized protein YcbK (DUF882 family)
VPVGTARPNRYRFLASRTGYACGFALLIVLFGCRGLQNAVAEGETRTITMHHIHTDESITIPYKREGRYDEAALEKLNWFLRDWRLGKETHMDPQLIDLLWEVQRETGSNQPIYVVCGYRAPETNAMLRRRSSGVARFSQHMLGHAVDFYVPGVPLQELRVIGLRMERGGVGFYPTSGSPFVHMDTGGVRMWPRMSRDQLLHVFPDGRTVYLPTDGHPLPGYTLALADLRKRGQDPSVTWFEEARAQGLNKKVVLASNQHPSADPAGQDYDANDPDSEADAREAARTPPTPSAFTPQVQIPAANDLQIALERLAARRREEMGLVAAASPAHIATAPTATAPTATAPTATGGAVYQTASYTPGGTPAANVTDATGAVARFAVADADDHVPPALALAYAAQAEQNPTPATAAAAAKPVRVAQVSATQPATTIIEKRQPDQAFSTIATHPRAAVAAGARFDDPWLAAVMISPSVRENLTVLTLGEQNYRVLAPLVEKPTRSVMMTFGADPNPGLTDDHFSGSAVVFVATINYSAHTALH